MRFFIPLSAQQVIHANENLANSHGEASILFNFVQSGLIGTIGYLIILVDNLYPVDGHIIIKFCLIVAFSLVFGILVPSKLLTEVRKICDQKINRFH